MRARAVVPSAPVCARLPAGVTVLLALTCSAAPPLGELSELPAFPEPPLLPEAGSGAG